MVTIAPYFYAYNVIFEGSLSSGAKLVYVYLCKCADREGKCFPSHKNISTACGVGVTTVKKSLSELEAAGFVKVQGQARSDKGRRANLYIITKEAVNGFFSAYATAFTEKLTAKARLVYLYLCRLASEGNTAYPAHKTTAKACGLSVAGVRLAIDELEAAGLIERQAQYRENGGQRSNLYTILFAPETPFEAQRNMDSCDAIDHEPKTQATSILREVEASLAAQTAETTEEKEETSMSATNNSEHPLIIFLKLLFYCLFHSTPVSHLKAPRHAIRRLTELPMLMKNIQNDKKIYFQKKRLKNRVNIATPNEYRISKRIGYSYAALQ